MKKDFATYKAIAKKIKKILSENDCANWQEQAIIINILLGTPYLLDDGAVIYEGEYYAHPSEVSEQGRRDIKCKYKDHGNASFLFI